jgi:hypothetical protein
VSKTYLNHKQAKLHSLRSLLSFSRHKKTGSTMTAEPVSETNPTIGQE